MPILSLKAFWDTDFSKIDYDKNTTDIIKRVFAHGTIDDVYEVRAAYGDDVVKQTLIKADYLDGYGRDLTCAIYRLKPSQLKCYTTTPFHKTY